jgi:hypothetical protein
MDDTVSRKAVLVLAVIAVMVSILSTTLVMNAVYHVNSNGLSSQNPQDIAPGGRVTLNVPQQPITGRVVFIVNNPQSK